MKGLLDRVAAAANMGSEPISNRFLIPQNTAQVNDTESANNWDTVLEITGKGVVDLLSFGASTTSSSSSYWAGVRLTVDGKVVCKGYRNYLGIYSYPMIYSDLILSTLTVGYNSSTLCPWSQFTIPSLITTSAISQTHTTILPTDWTNLVRGKYMHYGLPFDSSLKLEVCGVKNDNVGVDFVYRLLD